MTMKIAIVTGSILLALAGSASAQPGMTGPAPAAPEPLPVVTSSQRSPETALVLSLGGTIVSWGLWIGSSRLTSDEGTQALLSTAGGLGTFFAPSLGHW